MNEADAVERFKTLLASGALGPLVRKPLSTPSGAATSLMNLWLDFEGYIEQTGEFPPVMFADRDTLNIWAAEHTLTCEPISGYKESDILYIHGYGRKGCQYDAIWTRARFDDYREAVKAYWLKHWFCDGNTPAMRQDFDEACRAVHMDHVINRARLREHHSEAWVLLMPVPVEANRDFGWRVESKLGVVPPEAEIILLHPILMQKLFTFRGQPRTLLELQDAVLEVEAKMKGSAPYRNLVIDALLESYFEFGPDLIAELMAYEGRDIQVDQTSD